MYSNQTKEHKTIHETQHDNMRSATTLCSLVALIVAPNVQGFTSLGPCSVKNASFVSIDTQEVACCHWIQASFNIQSTICSPCNQIRSCNSNLMIIFWHDKGSQKIKEHNFFGKESTCIMRDKPLYDSNSHLARAHN